jgi:hypothetical protein
VRPGDATLRNDHEHDAAERRQRDHGGYMADRRERGQQGEQDHAGRERTSEGHARPAPLGHPAGHEEQRQAEEHDHGERHR